MNNVKKEQRCRRIEFKCKIYDLIKELDRSLKSECDQSKGAYGQRDMVGQQRDRFENKNKRKGMECCCPPGCCKESLEFRPPKLPLKTGGLNASDGEDSQNNSERHDQLGHLPWHKEDHAGGCWPGHGQGGGGGGGGIGHCAGMCYQGDGRSGPGGPTDFSFTLPTTAEEMQQKGCFIARAA